MTKIELFKEIDKVIADVDITEPFMAIKIKALINRFLRELVSDISTAIREVDS